MENEAGAPGASPAVTPTAACATSVVVRRPRSSSGNLPHGERQLRRTVGDNVGVERCMGNLAAARDRRGNWHGCPCAGAAGNARGGTTALRSRLGSAQRLASRRRDDHGSETVGRFLRLRSALCDDRSRAAGGKKSEKAERRDGRAQPALDRDTVALMGLKTRTRSMWRRMAMAAEIRHATARRRSTYPSARLPLHSAFAPSGRRTGYSCDIGAPRPTRSRMTMTGSRFPGSRVIASDHLPRDIVDPQWHLWPSAIRLQLRGQLRNCLPT